MPLKHKGEGSGYEGQAPRRQHGAASTHELQVHKESGGDADGNFNTAHIYHFPKRLKTPIEKSGKV
jgi:hypothetical protein